MESIGKKIQVARVKKDINQATLADLIKIDTHRLSDIERGKKSPTWDEINRTAEALDIPVFELIPMTAFNIFNSHFSDKASVNQIQHNFYSDPEVIKSIVDMVKSLGKEIKELKNK